MSYAVHEKQRGMHNSQMPYRANKKSSAQRRCYERSKSGWVRISQTWQLLQTMVYIKEIERVNWCVQSMHIHGTRWQWPNERVGSDFDTHLHAHVSACVCVCELWILNENALHQIPKCKIHVCPYRNSGVCFLANRCLWLAQSICRGLYYQLFSARAHTHTQHSVMNTHNLCCGR